MGSLDVRFDSTSRVRFIRFITNTICESPCT
jgi:hypothetical protein